MHHVEQYLVHVHPKVNLMHLSGLWRDLNHIKTPSKLQNLSIQTFFQPSYFTKLPNFPITVSTSLEILTIQCVILQTYYTTILFNHYSSTHELCYKNNFLKELVTLLQKKKRKSRFWFTLRNCLLTVSQEEKLISPQT